MYNIRRGSFFTMSNKGKDRNQNIKVFARVRPRNSQELRSNVVVECTSNKDISVKDKGQIKTFAFDRVFGPESKQVDVYKAVVAPMISEVLQGYNCTVFAYGQTGTGKTFTMVGDRSKDKCGGWENDPLSGIVPRTLDHLFDELKVKAEDYTVRVSFLELYNEELCDLLAPVDNDDTKTLRLFEDAMKKGSVIVAGLEERTVYEKNDVYPILEAGSLRRQTAPTLMNASSSRSHTIFMITVHVKVTTPEGEDLFKTGKLNLVDLAGSENIGRSGAVDMRAREAGNINQSLLTLGRVITSLVERTPHVPYRESKLTRILQDSLGGRTKTSIIATLSPALCNLEETLSTCDYAHRARNITNKPEINQKTSKHVLLKNYTDEIERLRRDLMATREKHGVYLQSEDYNGMLTQIESLNKDLVNKIQLLKVREDELAKQEDIMQSLNMNLYETKSNLDKNLEILQVKEEALKEREIALRELNDQAQLLLRTADEATEDSKKLHDRLDRARMIHNQNEELVEKFKSRFVQNLVTMKGSTQAFQKRSADLVKILTDISETRTKACQNHEQDVGSVLNGFLLSIENLLPKLSSQIIDQIDQSKPTFEENVSLVSTVGESLNEISDFVKSKTDSWSETRHPVWGNLSSKIGESRENQIKLGEDLKVVETCVKAGSAEILDLPSSVLASATEEEEYQRELQERDKIVDELDALRGFCNRCGFDFKEPRLNHIPVLSKEQKPRDVTERERVLAVALRNCNVALEEKRQRIENNRRQAAESAASAVTHKLCGLLELLTAMSNINNNLTGSGEGILGDVEKLRDDEVKDQKKLQTLLLDKLNKANETVIEICEKQRNEISVVESVVDEGRVAQSEMTSVVATFQQCIEDMTSEEEKRLNDHEVAAKAAHRQLANEVSDFCDQTFANIHDRCTELKVNLKEEFLKDEKTGTTPQRKEFQYPKRLVTTGKFIEGQENIPPVDITKRQASF